MPVPPVAEQGLPSKNGFSNGAADRTPLIAPQVIVDSPRSLRSPNRSPRTTSLLLALRDVIGDLEEEEGDSEQLNPNDGQTDSWAEALPTLVNDVGFGAYSHDENISYEDDTVDEYEEEEDSFTGNWTAISDYSDEDSGASGIVEEFVDSETNDPLDSVHDDNDPLVADREDTTQQMGNVLSNENPEPPLPTPTTPPNRHRPRDSVATSASGLLSPIELSGLHLGPFRRSSTGRSSNGSGSFDSGFAESWKPPLQLRASPPRSPSISSTFELLASPFGSHSARILSPRLSVFMPHSPRSPARTASPAPPDEIEPLDLGLDSPQDYQNASQAAETVALTQSPEDVTASWNDRIIDGDEEQRSSASTSDSEDFFESQEGEAYGHTSIWDSEGGATAVYLGDPNAIQEQVSEALSNQSRTPTVTSPAIIDSDFSPAANSTFGPAEDAIDEATAIVEADAVTTVEQERPPQELSSTISSGDHSSTNEGDRPNALFVSSVEAVREQVNDVILSQKTPTDSGFRRASHAFSRAGSPSVSSVVKADSEEADFPPSPIEVDSNDTITSASSSAFSDQDETAVLAYLQSPLPSARLENDTINSLYEIYSDIAPARDLLADSIRNAGLSPPQPASERLPSSSNVSTPASSLRERVFTPPPSSNRQRSGTVMADSPMSSSPMTSLDSLSRGRASPFSASSPEDDKCSGRDSVSPTSGQEVEMSRKIPFGFRTSFSLGRASRSSLMLNRNAGRTIPPSPLESEIPAEETPSAEPATSPDSAHSSSSARGLKPLRLSTVINANSMSRSLFQSRMSNHSVNSFRQSDNSNRSSVSSRVLPPTNTSSNSHLLSSTRSSLIPLRIPNILSTFDNGPPSATSQDFYQHPIHHDEPYSAPPISDWRPLSRLSEPTFEQREEFDDEDLDDTTNSFSNRDPYGETIRQPLPVAPHTAPMHIARAPSVPPQQHYTQMSYSITPRPTLMFAIASDDVEQVKQVLEGGDSNPNENVGPQSALQFALTNDKLANRLEIVKTLLAYGADPAPVKELVPPRSADAASDDQQEKQPHTLLDEMDPATRYYVERADAPHTKRSSALIHRSFFRPLTRVRYELVGQDRALEQLFRVLSMHSRELAVAPMVVLLCGPSGHGKSLLARKFGSLLDVPTHTVNMTTLTSTHDLWQSYSMSPYETPTTCTLAEFLINNEGKRCVVVLDEIEKTADEKTLWSLLMPWELGRCAFEASGRHVDVRNVIWLGTSNIGHDLVFQHHEERPKPEDPMSREEYVQLMSRLRPKVSERLGSSVLSRITAVLPFVPFTVDERKAICSEALHSLGGDGIRSLSPSMVESIIETALGDYIGVEGARSLYRAISNQLLDIL